MLTKDFGIGKCNVPCNRRLQEEKDGDKKSRNQKGSRAAIDDVSKEMGK